MAFAYHGAAQSTVSAVPQAHGLAGDSVYQVDATLTDQNGRTFTLKDQLAKPVLVSMFYTSCKFVCPMLIDTMQLTQQSLTPQERKQLALLLVTFDPARDDQKKLKAIADARELDSAHWTLARTDTNSARKVAATLGIQYRLLADGEYNHTTVLVLLDGEGRIVARTKRIGTADPEFIKRIQETIAASTRKGP